MRDELLSSWFVRLAWAHGEKLRPFCVRLFGRHRHVFSQDMDRGCSPEFVSILACRVHCTEAAVLALTLKTLVGSVLDAMPAAGKTPWLLPLNDGRTKRPLFGMQYCPACLAEDARPYFRKAWRLAFSVWCLRHRILLLDRCGQCGAGAALHRGDIGRDLATTEAPLVVCAECRSDRRTHPTSPATQSDDAGLALQRQMEAATSSSWVRAFDQEMPSLAFFEGLRILWSLLADTRRSARLWQWLGREDSIACWPAQPRYGGVEAQPLVRRRQLLDACAGLLQGGAPACAATLHAARMNSDAVQRFCRWGRERTPFWLWKETHFTIDRTMYVPTDKELDAALRHEKRKASHPRIEDVCRAAGMATHSSARVRALMRTAAAKEGAPRG